MATLNASPLDQASSSDNKTKLLESNPDEQGSSPYNPFQFPPDIEKARRHKEATRVKGPSDPLTRDPCECCDRDTNTKQIPFSCELKELYQFRYCVPLFFQFSKFCIYSLLSLLIIFGFWSMIHNYHGNYDKPDSKGFFHKLNVLGISTKEDLYKQAFFMLLAAGSLIGIRGVFRDKQKKIVRECDNHLSSPSDYAVRVTGLGGLQITEDDLKDFFIKHTESKDPESVKKVIFAYDIEELINLLRQKQNLKNSKYKLKLLSEVESEDAEKMSEEETIKKLEEIEKEYAQVEAKIKQTSQSSQKGLGFTGTAFVIFNRQSDAKLIKKKWKKFAITWFLIKLFGCCFGNYKVKGRFIKVQYAPEPADIIWENSAYAWDWKLFQGIKSNMTTITASLIAAAIQLALSYYKHKKVGFMFPFLSTLSSFVIVGVNSALVIIIRKAASAERHFSYTNYHQSVAEKLIRAQFVNSTLIPICVNLLMHFIPGEEDQNLSLVSVLDGLATDMYYVFFSNAISTPLTLFFDPFFTLRAFRQASLEADNTAYLMTQHEVNSLFEYPQFDVSSKYAGNIKTMWMTAFFAPLLPVCIPMSLGGLFLKEIVDKFIFLKRNSAPPMTGKKLAKAMIAYFEMTPFWFGLGSFLINKFYDPDPINSIYNWGAILSLLAMMGSVIRFILPTRLVHETINIKKKDLAKTKPYHDAQFLFDTDYDRANPVTKAKAEEAHLIDCIKVTDDEEAKRDLQEALDELQKIKSNKEYLGSTLADYVNEQSGLENAFSYQGYLYGGNQAKKTRKHRNKGYTKFKRGLQESQMLENNANDGEANQEDQKEKKYRKKKHGRRNQQEVIENNQYGDIYNPDIEIGVAL